MMQLAGVTVHTLDRLDAGDEILVSSKQGWRVVSDVQKYDDGYWIVWYFKRGEATYENKARDSSGYNVQDSLVEKAIIFEPDETRLLPVRKGTPNAAAELQAQMIEEQEARTIAIEERRERGRRFELRKGRR